MSTVEKGVVVRVVLSRDHDFEPGELVTSTGVPYGYHNKGNWTQFVDEEGRTQYLLPQHYTIVEAPAPKVVAEDLPSKAVYAVVKKDGTIQYTGDDRDNARAVKAWSGGKRKGVRIFQYTAVKEIR
jgi:hypothetical protein